MTWFSSVCLGKGKLAGWIPTEICRNAIVVKIRDKNFLIRFTIRPASHSCGSMMILESGILIDAYFVGRMMDDQAVIAINVIISLLALLMNLDHALTTALSHTVRSLNYVRNPPCGAVHWMTLIAGFVAGIVIFTCDLVLMSIRGISRQKVFL